MGFLGISFPWETPAGEGFIAPWTEKQALPTGEIGQAGQVYFAEPTLQTSSVVRTPQYTVPIVQNSVTVRPPPANIAPLAINGGPGMAYNPIESGDVAVVAPTVIPNSSGSQTQEQVEVGMNESQDISNGVESTVAGAVVGGVGGLTGVGVGGQVATALGGGLLGILGAAGIGALLSRIKFPWQTPEGEGFIAPWTSQQQLESGLWGQEGVVYGNGNTTPGVTSAGVGTVTPYGVVTKTWTNASRNGATPATVAFAQVSNGYRKKIVAMSLATGALSVYTPKKHIVISSNPRVSSIRKLQKVTRKVNKLLPNNKIDSIPKKRKRR